MLKCIAIIRLQFIAYSYAKERKAMIMGDAFVCESLVKRFTFARGRKSNTC